jgi:hypothetical protein
MMTLTTGMMLAAARVPKSARQRAMMARRMFARWARPGVGREVWCFDGAQRSNRQCSAV